jgi:iron complex outermembrane receptor protein
VTGQLFNSLLIAGIVSVLIAQPVQAEVVQVTGVEVNSNDNGLQVILKTTSGQPLQVLTANYGATFVANIINTQLALPESNSFRSNNPIEGIAAVEVTQQSGNSIRVSVISNTGVPTAEVNQSDRGLVLSVTPSADTRAEQPTLETPEQEPTPTDGNVEEPDEREPTLTDDATNEQAEGDEQLDENGEETTSEQAEGDQPIEIVVTASRTEEKVTNVPRSVTVIDREEIEQQTRLSRNLTDILGFTVPGLSPSNQSIGSFGQNLRGRSVSVLIDGVPQTANLQTFNRELRTIDPAAIERIEVIRGSSASYGSQGTGGVINIITRRPSEEGLISQTYAGVNTSLTNSEDSFGYELQHLISAREDNFDVTASFSIATTGAFYDAEGDRIPVFELGGDSSTTLNGLLKFGVDLSPDQRLQLTFNHFDDSQAPDVISDPIVDELPGTQKARALEVGELDFINTPGPGNRNTIVNLAYKWLCKINYIVISKFSQHFFHIIN